MNLAGKILTGLILFLSIAFLVLAVMVGATHRNWKQVASDNANKVREAQNILNSYKGKSEEIKRELNAERVARTLQLSQLESQLNAAREDFDNKEKLLRDQLAISQKAQDALNIAETRIQQQDGVVAELRSKNKTLVDDISAQVQSVVNLTNQNYQLQGDLEKLQVTNMDLTNDIALREKVLNANGLTPNDLTSHIPPDVEGVVLRTMLEQNLIAISLGGDDGVREGHTFDVYRGDRFIGKARVVKSRNNMSAAKLIPEFLQAPVAQGDYVTTKL